MPAQTINLDANGDTPPNADNTEHTGYGPSTAPPRTRDVTKLRNQLRDFYAQFGTYAALMAPDPFLGLTVQSNAETLADAWADLAAQDPAVRRALQKMLSGGAWAGVIGGHVVGIALPVLAYYGRLPDGVTAMVMNAAHQSAQQEGNTMLAATIAQRFGVAPTE